MTLRELLAITSKPTRMRLSVYENYKARDRIAIIDIEETYGSHDRRSYLTEVVLDMMVGRISLNYTEDDAAYLSIDIYICSYPVEGEKEP